MAGNDLSQRILNFMKKKAQIEFALLIKTILAGITAFSHPCCKV